MKKKMSVELYFHRINHRRLIYFDGKSFAAVGHNISLSITHPIENYKFITSYEKRVWLCFICEIEIKIKNCEKKQKSDSRRTQIVWSFQYTDVFTWNISRVFCGNLQIVWAFMYIESYIPSTLLYYYETYTDKTAF